MKKHSFKHKRERSDKKRKPKRQCCVLQGLYSSEQPHIFNVILKKIRARAESSR